MKKVLTTGQIAKICKVAPRTVSKWFDSGRLRGYRIPGSQDRRVPRENVVKFLKENGMPLGELEEEGQLKVLLVSVEQNYASRLQEMLPASDNCKYKTAGSGFEAGMAAESFHPDVIVIDCGIGRPEALQMIKSLRDCQQYEQTLIVVLASEDEVCPEEFDCDVFKKPFDIALLAQQMTTKAEELEVAA